MMIWPPELLQRAADAMIRATYVISRLRADLAALRSALQRAHVLLDTIAPDYADTELGRMLDEVREQARLVLSEMKEGET